MVQVVLDVGIEGQQGAAHESCRAVGEAACAAAVDHAGPAAQARRGVGTRSPGGELMQCSRECGEPVDARAALAGAL